MKLDKQLIPITLIVFATLIAGQSNNSDKEKLDISIACHTKDVDISYRPSSPFTGEFYVLNSAAPCIKSFTNVQEPKWNVNFDKCKEKNEKKNTTFVLVINNSTSPFSMKNQVEYVNISCIIPANSTTIVSRIIELIKPNPRIITSSLAEPINDTNLDIQKEVIIRWRGDHWNFGDWIRSKWESYKQTYYNNTVTYQL